MIQNHHCSPSPDRFTSSAIDLVYLWYGAKEPPVGMEKCRACDNGELYWSLKSVDRFAPWLRKIFVLVNDGTAIPEWLAANPRVEVVELGRLIPRNILPLNNSAAIEMWISKVPGLSEYFVYGNDDFFFGSEVCPSDFFDGRGRIVYRYRPRERLRDFQDSPYFDMLRYGRSVLGCRSERMPHHNFQGYRKSVIEEFWSLYPGEVRESAGRRYRVGEQFCMDEFALYAAMTKRAVWRRTYVLVRLNRMLGLAAYDSMYAAIEDHAMMDWIAANRPKMFCLNDTEKSTDADRARIGPFMERMLEEVKGR